MEQTRDVLMKLRKAKAHFQKKAFLEENETSATFYKGKASGLQLAIEHLQSIMHHEKDTWEQFIDKMYEEWKDLQEVNK